MEGVTCYCLAPSKIFVIHLISYISRNKNFSTFFTSIHVVILIIYRSKNVFLTPQYRRYRSPTTLPNLYCTLHISPIQHPNCGGTYDEVVGGIHRHTTSKHFVNPNILKLVLKENLWESMTSSHLPPPML